MAAAASAGCVVLALGPERGLLGERGRIQGGGGGEREKRGTGLQQITLNSLNCSPTKSSLLPYPLS